MNQETSGRFAVKMGRISVLVVTMVMVLGMAVLGEETPWPGTSYKVGMCEQTVWIPDGIDTLRGIMMAEKPIDHDWSNLCAMWEFAHINHNVWPCNSSMEKVDWTQMFNEAAEVSGHPELKHAPFICHGFSRHGDEPMHLMQWYPERTITVSSGQPVRASEDHPAGIPILHSHECGQGKSDEGYPGIRGMQGKLSGHRDAGKQVCYVPMWGWGHGYYSIRDFEWVWFDRMIKLRVPEGESAVDGVVDLIPLDESKAWTGNPSHWYDSAHMLFPEIMPFDEYSGDAARVPFIPTEELAWLWRAYSTRHPTETQKDQGQSWVGGMSTTYKFPGQANMMITSPIRPYHLGKVGGKNYKVVMIGSSLTLNINNIGNTKYQNMSKLRVYDGKELLSEMVPNLYGFYNSRITLNEPGVRFITLQVEFEDGNVVSTRQALVYVVDEEHYNMVMETSVKRNRVVNHAEKINARRPMAAFDIRGRALPSSGRANGAVQIIVPEKGRRSLIRLRTDR